MAKELILPTEIENDPLIHQKCKKTPVNHDSIEGMTRDKDYKVVGSFVHIEYPGLPQKFCGKFYKGMPYFNQVLHDNEKVTIPLSIARFINERWAWQKPQHSQDDKGNPIKDYQPIARGKFIIEQHLKAA
jgi:hypothetical protein